MHNPKGTWDKRRDNKLVRRARKGDAKAFEKLVERYQRPVYACIIRLVRSHEATDDLIQESFIRVHNNLHRFDERYPFYPWVRRIAVNATLNYLKSAAGRHLLPLDAVEDTVSDENPGEQLEQREMLRCLRRALLVLPEEQRMVFLLRTREEMSYQEIADALGISMGTVMSRLNRARARLKDLMKDHL